ncbi:MBL fold metallo-hydrolase [uncultured Boseongicola sp.]|jgi:metallo-beta-lactamase family protein|uniref:MBL fold metallo-hydrolase RNA specificity domain-containing protein n=1 Tax=uncultured Boseongicola sp. TaxID=1648499 RepID=UPI00262A3B68|nr:MBL fold metallo-hydrolase [uncultured Boseongicola sp.]
MPDATLRFCGAARTVTGSCYWLQTDQCSFLVDCGLFQGPKTLKELNYRPFPFDPPKIDFVLQTHAHIDHAGLLPKLSASGFQGPIYATAGTRDLLTFMLPDSGYIQEMEVDQLNLRNLRHGKPEVEPIYTRQDAEDCLTIFETVDYEVWTPVGPGVRARFWNAGHILGSASIEVEIDQENSKPIRLLFSGDIGPDNKLFHPDPDAPSDFDYVISEATYGGRERADVTPAARMETLRHEVSRALDHNGMLLIPVFAVERTQELITDLLALQDAGDIPKVPVYLDSPLAIRVTKVFQRHARDLEDLGPGPRLISNPAIRPTETVEQSKQIAKITGGAIILAASGMCEAGRIRHHLKQWLWQDKATVLFVGYQAIGTLGRILSEGAKSVKVHGEEIRVKARIRKVDTYSGHADGSELTDWIIQRRPIREALILTHGEEPQMNALKSALMEKGFADKDILIPNLDDQIALSADGTSILEPPQDQRMLPEALGGPDWHNDLTELVFELRDIFEQAADDKARAKVLRRIRRALKDDA